VPTPLGQIPPLAALAFGMTWSVGGPASGMTLTSCHSEERSDAESAPTKVVPLPGQIPPLASFAFGMTPTSRDPEKRSDGLSRAHSREGIAPNQAPTSDKVPSPRNDCSPSG
jgi:hypothetical protein